MFFKKKTSFPYFYFSYFCITDGSPPSQEIVDRWLNVVKNEFTENPDTCVGVHCVTGLGRAPVLVAIALMELGMKYDEAVDAIRNR